MCALCRVEIQHKTYYRLTKNNHRFQIKSMYLYVKVKNFTLRICITDFNYANQSKNYFRPRRKICAELSCFSSLFCSFLIQVVNVILFTQFSINFREAVLSSLLQNTMDCNIQSHALKSMQVLKRSMIGFLRIRIHPAVCSECTWAFMTFNIRWILGCRTNSVYCLRIAKGSFYKINRSFPVLKTFYGLLITTLYKGQS